MNTINSLLLEHFGDTKSIDTVQGYKTAVAFADAETEYTRVRQGVGISDQGHYGKFRITGSDALDFLNNLNLPDVARLPIGRAMTSFLLGDEGEVFCEAYILAIGDSYMLLTEGRDVEAVSAYLKSNVGSYAVAIEDVTSQISLIGLDGPFSWELLKDLIGVRILGLRYLEIVENQKIAGTSAHVIRAGKTGEFGYMLMVGAAQAADLWKGLLAAGGKYDIQAIGTATLDLCRLENRFPNMRIEGSRVSNPLELNCRVMFDREKEEHKGREALEALMSSGPSRRLIGFEVHNSSHVPAVGDKVFVGDQEIGEVANAQFSLGLNKPIGLALLTVDFAFVGIEYEIRSEAGNLSATTVSAPFISNRSMTIRPQEDSYFN